MAIIKRVTNPITWPSIDKELKFENEIKLSMLAENTIKVPCFKFEISSLWKIAVKPVIKIKVLRNVI